MKIQIVIEGTLRNKVIERDIPESSLMSTLSFINQYGLFEADRWIPAIRIKEIKFDRLASNRLSRMYLEPKEIDDNLLTEETP